MCSGSQLLCPLPKPGEGFTAGEVPQNGHAHLSNKHARACKTRIQYALSACTHAHTDTRMHTHTHAHTPTITHTHIQLHYRNPPGSPQGCHSPIWSAMLGRSASNLGPRTNVASKTCSRLSLPLSRRKPSHATQSPISSAANDSNRGPQAGSSLTEMARWLSEQKQPSGVLVAQVRACTQWWCYCDYSMRVFMCA